MADDGGEARGEPVGRSVPVVLQIAAEVGDEPAFGFFERLGGEFFAIEGEDAGFERGFLSKGDAEGIRGSGLADDAQEIAGAWPEGEVAAPELGDLFSEFGVVGEVTTEGHFYGDLSVEFCGTGFAELRGKEGFGEDDFVDDEGFFLRAGDADAQGGGAGGGGEGGEAVNEFAERVPGFTIGGDFEDAMGEGGAIV